jgi:cell wall integrity and stress response component
MKSISSLALVAATLFVAVSNATDDNLPAQGCFSSTLGLKVAGTTDIYTSKGSCSKLCLANGSTVFGLTNSTWCYCGTTIPPVDTQVANSSCNTGCPGFPADKCGGGSKYTSVYLLNDSLQGTVSNINDDGSTPSGTTVTTPSHTASTTQSVVTVVNGQTVYVTPTATATGKSSSGGPSKAGIAAGVVVGLIAIAAIAGGVFLSLRNKKRREVEEEYRRNAAINQFTQGGKHPSSSAGASTLSDMRLDPAVMAQRRMSDGSIADNQDYSRRILKVTNA